MSATALLGSVLLHVLAQVSVIVSAPVDVSSRDPMLVQVEVTAPPGRAVQVLAPSFAPFRVITSTTIAGAEATSGPGGVRAAHQTLEYRYMLAPPADASGRFDFGPFEARVSAPGLRTAIARSRAWSVTVHPPQIASTPVPEIVTRARVNPRTGINFHALAVPETVYVGQQSTYQVGVFLDEGVRTRLRRNPEFLPPELRAMLAYELPAGRASLRDREIAGKRWDVHVFQRAVFPLAPGRTDVPPAQLSYSLPLSLGFFSREESYTARAEAATVVALAPPEAGRPADWVGAVGVLKASARLDTNAARVGDPVVLTLRVEGTGNVKLLPRPPLAIAWAGAVPGEERVEIDSTALLVRGAKEFDWIVTPRVAGAQQMPAIRYPFFDPYARAYELTGSEPMPMRIEPGTLAAADDPARPPALSIRRVDGGARPRPLPTRAVYWLLVLVAPIPALVVLVARRPRRAARPLSAAARLRSVARTGPADVRALRRVFASALGERLALRASSAHVASARPGVMARRLRRCGVTEETAHSVETHLRALDAAAYDAAAPGAAADVAALRATSLALYERVHGEARVAGALHEAADRDRRHAGRGARIARSAVFAVGALAAAASLHALAEPDAPFAAGVEAYGRGQYADAQREFGRAARNEPRSPDAWANFGTASWAAADTVAATVGWQRALRLDPRAGDVRDRLTLVPGPQDGSIAGVPALPLDWVAAAGALLWVVACAALLARAAGQGRAFSLGAVAAGGFVGAAACAVVGVQIARVASARDLAVVRGAAPLRRDPALGAESLALVQATDVARILRRESVWARVALDGGREGWIEVERLAPLDVD